MVNLNPCGGVGIVFAVAAAAVSFVQVTRREFVEVFIPTDVDNKDSGILTLSCAIAGLGVYTTEYDSSCLDEYTLANSRVPVEAFESPTTEFKLLFPAQQNFVAEVLPINRALISQLDATLGNTATSQLLLPLVEKVEETKFESCDQYVDDAKTNLDSLFLNVNNGLLPQLIPLIAGGNVALLSTTLTSISGALSAPPESNFLSVVLQTTFNVIQPALAGFENQCPGVSALSASSVATEEQLGCIAQAFQAVGSNPLLQASSFYKTLLAGMANHINSFCVGAGVFQIQACLGAINVRVLDTDLFESAEFDTTFPSPVTLCDVLNGCPDVKLGLISVIATLVNDVLNLLGANAPAFLGDVLKGLQANLAVGSVFESLISETNGTTADVIGVLSIATQPLGFPSSFTAFYVPCGMLQLFEIINGLTIPDVPNVGEACGFDKFFLGASAVANTTNPDFVPLLEQLNVLYTQCALALPGPNICGAFFTGLFLNGAYSFGLDATDVFNSAKTACQDDEKDIEKITAAQTLLGAAVAVYILAVVIGVAGMVVSVFNKPVFGVAAGLSFLALVLNIVALLQVRSAPVYESVGQPSVRFRPKYIEGSVVTLATVSVGLSIAAGVSYLVAVCIQGKGSKAAVGGADVKTVAVLEAEEVKQTV